MNILNSIIQIILVLLLVFISKSFTNLRFKFEVFNDIIKIRYKDSYLSGISNLSEKEEYQFYFGALLFEREKSYKYLISKYPNKKVKDIIEILNEIYPELKEFKYEHN